MKSVLPTAIILLALTCAALAGPAPGNSQVLVDDKFDRAELGDGWHVNTGDWKIVDGVLTVSEIPAEKHSAAARRAAETRNAVYELKFRFTDGAKAFHLGFDPAAGQLDKKGHLFSVIVTPTSWKIMKHVDKNNPKENPNEILAQQETPFAIGEWHTLRITTWGPSVKAKMNDFDELIAMHPTFGVTKPTVVLRALGQGIEIDDLKVWGQK